jgi:hypothetical protein
MKMNHKKYIGERERTITIADQKEIKLFVQIKEPDNKIIRVLLSDLIELYMDTNY